MTTAQFERLRDTLARYPNRIVACSGGVDSMLLADVAVSLAPDSTIVAHSVSPAVPAAATERVGRVATELGWRLELVRSAEFDDQRYLDNPVDRCYFCKINLYDELDRLAAGLRHLGNWVLMSGANAEDLGEYRPGLRAAAEHGVRHPYVEANFSKADIRRLTRGRGRAWHDLAAAPCLASRLYTGTPVTPSILRAIEHGEEALRQRTGLMVVRCRVRGTEVLVEVPEKHRYLVDGGALTQITGAVRRYAPELQPARLDHAAYAPGRAFVRLERKN